MKVRAEQLTGVYKNMRLGVLFNATIHRRDRATLVPSRRAMLLIYWKAAGAHSLHDGSAGSKLSPGARAGQGRAGRLSSVD